MTATSPGRHVGISSVPRQGEFEQGAAVLGPACGDRAAMGLDGGERYGQAEAAPHRRGRRTPVPETLEDMGEVLGRDTGTGVGDTDDVPLPGNPAGQVDP